MLHRHRPSEPSLVSRRARFCAIAVAQNERQALQCHIYTAVEVARHNAPVSTVGAELGVAQGGGLFDGSTDVAGQDLELFLLAHRYPLCRPLALTSDLSTDLECFGVIDDHLHTKH